MSKKKALKSGKVVLTKHLGKVSGERILAEIAKVLILKDKGRGVHKDA
jgi:hypothetical protein